MHETNIIFEKFNLKNKNQYIGIFDMDGVIIESIPLWNEINTKFFKSYGVGYDAVMYQKEICGLSYDKTVEHISVNYIKSLTPSEIYEQMTNMAIEKFIETKINEYILNIAMSGFRKTILCTANIRPIAKAVLDKIYALYNFSFDKVITSDDQNMRHCHNKYDMYESTILSNGISYPISIFDDSLNTLEKLRSVSPPLKLVYVDNGHNFDNSRHTGITNLRRLSNEEVNV
ncbi:HAD family hydrolase [Vallitalea okinawensis]|uniref:HAD family hydrolase n=1 Tax=Vallitalea okinawensis TaxID=2078660 RepID=UPI000CFDD485|nr:HAD hydrolase-like protein [Vallitalea okinawensis]